ncbi:MAG: hypothetical protein JSR17_11040 [Proteobacteria bacterium]|nr:hypothetical protein [Pseudomonadota bacterium]
MSTFLPGFNNQQNHGKEQVKSAQTARNNSDAIFDMAAKSDPANDQALIAQLKASQTTPNKFTFSEGNPKIESLQNAEARCNQAEKNPQVEAQETKKPSSKPGS